jgi:hypothetical protein
MSHAKRQAMAKTIEDVYELVIELRTQLAGRKYLDDMTIKHEESIKGNGKPGLEDRVKTVEDWMIAEKDNRKYFSRLVMGATVANIIGFVFAAIVWFVKIYPVIEKLSQEVAAR